MFCGMSPTCSGAPRLSVVVTTFDHPELLSSCLAAFSDQSQDPSSFEVVVVDRGVDDRTPELLAAIEAPFRLRNVNQAGLDAAAAWNAGIAASSGTICAFVSGTVVAVPELLAEHVAAHEASERIIGFGRVVAPSRRDSYDDAFLAAWNRRVEGLAARHPG